MLLAFIFSAFLAYWNKGLYVYLLYTLLYEIVIFASFSISPKRRASIILSSLLGYVVGSAIFYSSVRWNYPGEKTFIGKEMEKCLAVLEGKVKDNYYSFLL